MKKDEEKRTKEEKDKKDEWQQTQTRI